MCVHVNVSGVCVGMCVRVKKLKMGSFNLMEQYQTANLQFRSIILSTKRKRIVEAVLFLLKCSVKHMI